MYSLVSTRTGAEVWYAGANNGVYRSTDQGESWQAASDGLGQDKRTYQVAIDPAHADTVFAGTPSGLFRKHVQTSRERKDAGVLRNRRVT